MKRLSALVLLSLLFALPVFAAGHSQDLTLIRPLQFGSSTLPAGEYKLTWTGSGSSAQVTLAKKDVPPVTVPAQVVQQKNNSVTISTKDLDGKQTIKSISLKDVTLVF